MTRHEQWTDQLSDYLDGELAAADREALETHLRECPDCAGVLNDLERVVARARTLEPRPPRTDLWPGIDARIGRAAPPRRWAFTLPQLAAAAMVLMAVSGGLVWQFAVKPLDRAASSRDRETSAGRTTTPSVEREASAERSADVNAERFGAPLSSVGFADAQYDAAVADLEKALRAGRGRLDQGTIAIVEHNLQIIDQAIAQAREALAADPANTYLSGHLVEARRRKLDLLRRAALLAETN
jgi:negative regulator of sigma E activity